MLIMNSGGNNHRNPIIVLFAFIWQIIIGYVGLLYGILQAALLSESYAECSGEKTGLLNPDCSLYESDWLMSPLNEGAAALEKAVQKNESTAAVVGTAIFAPYLSTTTGGSSAGGEEVIEVIVYPVGTLDDDMPYDVVEKRAQNIYMANKKDKETNECLIKTDELITYELQHLFGKKSLKSDVLNRLKTIEEVLSDGCNDNQ